VSLQLVQEIESRAIVSQQQIGIVKAQIGAKQRDIRLLELTSSELGALSKDTNVYEGVGKMYVLFSSGCDPELPDP
jgi:Prefoldin subunit.